MKLALPILAAIAASSEAAFCNGGWGLPSGSSCPSPYVSTAQITRKPASTNCSQSWSFCCQEPGSPNPTFPTFRNCVYPGRGGQPALDSCNGSGFIQCVSELGMC
ncbi:hypothetical protein AA0114_g7549 [Alternaria tenuissima]|uniref:Uncharacterized protein n=1 Tax=Alternaria tenuissima TaxID=119927 RepID=A0A4Q4MDU1_9PLEO|nr:hypothetical protein AA0114_g7549 [Alternaria tenuissima]